MTSEQMNAAVQEFVQSVQENGHIDITLQRETASAIIAALQLALRHPGISESGSYVASKARGFCELLIEACSLDDHGQAYPLVREMLEAGFNPQHDT